MVRLRPPWEQVDMAGLALSAMGLLVGRGGCSFCRTSSVTAWPFTAPFMPLGTALKGLRVPSTGAGLPRGCSHVRRGSGALAVVRSAAAVAAGGAGWKEWRM